MESCLIQRRQSLPVNCSFIHAFERAPFVPLSYDRHSRLILKFAATRDARRSTMQNRSRLGDAIQREEPWCYGACPDFSQAMQVRPRQEHSCGNLSAQANRPCQVQLPRLPLLQLSACFWFRVQSEKQSISRTLCPPVPLVLRLTGSSRFCIQPSKILLN